MFLVFPPAVPKSYRTVTLKPRYVPNHHICVPLHPYQLWTYILQSDQYLFS